MADLAVEAVDQTSLFWLFFDLLKDRDEGSGWSRRHREEVRRQWRPMRAVAVSRRREREINERERDRDRQRES
jgi:hypothetical protein